MDDKTTHVRLPDSGVMDELNRLIQAKGKTELTPLQVVVLAKRINKFADALAHNMLILANKQFTELCTTDTDTKQWRFGPANVRCYSPSCVWIYPDEIVELETRLRAVKQESQDDGTATKTVPVVDPNTKALFSVVVDKGP